MPIEIKEWAEIREEFTDTLLLGNGASISLNNCFSYPNLFEKASTSNLLEEPVKEIFDIFESQDFEYVLRKLFHTFTVNHCFNIECERIDQAYNQVKEALINVVREIHVEHSSALINSNSVTSFLSSFKTIFCLNYDLILYWFMLEGNDNLGAQFKDCFIHGEFAENWTRFRNPIGSAESTTLIFYPHGNLILGKDKEGKEKKISSSGNSLLSIIFDSWNSLTPIFISEATSKIKKQSILESPYLSRVFYEALPESKDSIVIYGWSMSNNDNHILAQLSLIEPKPKLAISVFQNDDNFVTDIQRKLLRKGFTDVTFFDSQSSGCWINPEESA
jgi:hypothetical protein